MYDLSELPLTDDAEILVIINFQEAIQSAINYFAEAAEEFSDACDYIVQVLEEFLETVRNEKQPEDNETLGGYHCPCSRQNPDGHRIPWYTAGFT